MGTHMPLTDIKVRNIKPKAKPYKLFDEKGFISFDYYPGFKMLAA
jgi:hypothetical protein